MEAIRAAMADTALRARIVVGVIARHVDTAHPNPRVETAAAIRAAARVATLVAEAAAIRVVAAAMAGAGINTTS